MTRLFLAILFFLLSLLCVMPAPTIQLWYVAILVTEFPWIFIGCALLLLLWGLKVKKQSVAGTIFSSVAFLVFLVPVADAYRISSTLNDDLEHAFRTRTYSSRGEGNKAAFSFTRMLFPDSGQEVPYTVLPYSSCAEGPLTLDYCRANKTGKRPCIVVVHGGSWTGGDSRQLPELNSCLANAGYQVVSINYRLVPKYQCPAPEEDVAAAIHYLRLHCDELAIDTTNFVLLGRSAGGQIVLEAGYNMYECGIKGVIDFYGPADMVWGYAHPANPLVLNSCKLMEDYLGGTYAAVPDHYIHSSGTAAVTKATPPTLIIHGADDPLVSYEHSVRLDKELTTHGVEHFFLSLPWATHGFDYNINGPGGQLSTYAILRFLCKVTGTGKKG